MWKKKNILHSKTALNINSVDNIELINSKDIEKNKLKWAMTDNFEDLLYDKSVFLLNTDTSQGDGIHWIVLTCFNDICYIIDPLGNDNDRPYNELMEDTIRNKGYKVVYYPYEFQMEDSNHCGWFSIYIAKLLQRLYKKNGNITADIIRNAIVNEFGKTADNGDEKKLYSAFGLKRV